MERRGSEDNDNHKRGLSEAEALCLGKNMAAALGALHRRGLVHHDVKPENLFVQPGDPLSDRTEVYLGDYSSVKPVKCQYQGHMSVTRAFAAPEILEQRPYSYSCDVYSWCRALLMMSRTTWPRFDEQTPAVFSVESGKGVIVHQGNRFWVIWPCGNDALLAVIERAFQTYPELRFSDGAQLLQALETISQEYP